jgi:hypothetical protein
VHDDGELRFSNPAGRNRGMTGIFKTASAKHTAQQTV